MSFLLVWFLLLKDNIFNSHCISVLFNIQLFAAIAWYLPSFPVAGDTIDYISL